MRPSDGEDGEDEGGVELEGAVEEDKGIKLGNLGILKPTFAVAMIALPVLTIF